MAVHIMLSILSSYRDVHGSSGLGPYKRPRGLSTYPVNRSSFRSFPMPLYRYNVYRPSVNKLIQRDADHIPSRISVKSGAATPAPDLSPVFVSDSQ